jgi:hypothetical protein
MGVNSQIGEMFKVGRWDKSLTERADLRRRR